METFSTATPPVFSELIIVLSAHWVMHFSRDAMLSEMLRTIDEVGHLNRRFCPRLYRVGGRRGVVEIKWVFSIFKPPINSLRASVRRRNRGQNTPI